MRSQRALLTAAALTVASAARAVHAFVPPLSRAPLRSTLGTSAAASTLRPRQTHENRCSTSESQRPRRSRRVLRCALGGNEDKRAIDDVLDAELSGPRKRWPGVKRWLTRGATSFATIAAGTTAFTGLSAEVQQRLGGSVAVPAAMQSAGASVIKPFSKRTVEEKLGNLPAYMVTNTKGSPYLTPTGTKSRQLAVFFTNLDDAKEMLREMVQSEAYAKDARILIVSMEKAYGMVKAGPRPTGYTNDNGMAETMDFKLERDMHSLPKARKLGLQLDVDAAAVTVDIPVFYAEGLQIKRDGSMVRPLFMDPADLLEAWKKVAESNPDAPEKPSIKVFSFPEVLISMETSDELKDFGFFASSDGAEYIKKGREESKGFPKPRLGRMWSF